MRRIPGIRRVFRLPESALPVEAEIDEELGFHLESRVEALVADGMAPEAARAAALREFGDMSAARRELAAIDRRRRGRARWARWWEDLAKDARFAVRGLVRTGGFALVAVITLAVGIGANSAIFTVVNAVLVRPLPFADAGRLILLWETYQDVPEINVSYPDYADWRTRNRVFAGMAGFIARQTATLTGAGDPARLAVGWATAELFPTLGVSPVLGRAFTRADDRAGAPRTALLGWGFWQRRFGGDRGVLGRTLTLDGHPVTVVGVLPRRFQLLSEQDLWLPFSAVADTTAFLRYYHSLGVVGRLRPGLDKAVARRDIARVARELAQEHPKENEGIGVGMAPLADAVLGKVRPTLLMLLGAAGFILLIACANVANLLLARSASRREELAVRVALGAGQGRLLRQLLTESLVLAIAAALVGVGLAWLGTGALRALAPADLPRVEEIRVDRVVLGFTAALAVVTALLSGLAPALHGARAAVASALRGRGTASGPRVRVRAALVASEVALSLALLIGATLVIGSLVRLLRVSPGFDPGHVLVMGVDLPESRYPEDARRHVFFRQLLERFAAVPGVESAALVDPLPFGPHGWQTSIAVEGQALPDGADPPLVDASVVSPGYFRTLRIPIRRGRPFSPADGPGAPRVALVSEAFARRFWPGADPIGKRLRQGKGDSWIEVVGVAGDVHRGSLAQPPRAEVYFPAGQRPLGGVSLALRTRGEPLAMVPALRPELARLDPELPLAEVASLDHLVDASVAGRRFAVVLLGIAGAVALLLALGGIYAVIASIVAGARREIGVRMALGARPASVVARIVARGMRPVALGLVVGVAAAFALSRTLASLLFGVSRHDPLTFALSTALLALVAGLATYLPARRATRVDPVAALRSE